MSSIKSTLGQKVFRGGIVRNRFHNADVRAEGVFDKLLAVAGDGAARDCDFVPAQLINPT